MSDPIIAPVEDEWQTLPTLDAQITAWEAAHAVRLPAAYRAFLLAYNGGSPYPNVFDVAVPDAVWDSTDKQTFVDPLYDFAYASSLFAGDTFGDGTPKGFFFIGCNPGGLELLISLRSKDAGSIHCWYGTDVAWGTADNTEAAVYLQAGSFPDFVKSLYDTDDKIGYDYWESPRHKMLARPLTVG